MFNFPFSKPASSKLPANRQKCYGPEYPRENALLITFSTTTSPLLPQDVPGVGGHGFNWLILKGHQNGFPAVNFSEPLVPSGCQSQKNNEIETNLW